MELEYIRKIYNGYSSFYDLIFKGMFYPRIESAIKALEIQPEEKILEVGIGTGLSLSAYPNYCEVVGIDISEQMLNKAKEKASSLNLKKVEMKIMDASRLEFEDDTFDHVLAAFVITVVPDPLKVLKEIKRVTKPGGKIAIVNHFLSENKTVAKIEGVLSPLCQKLGWNSDLSLEQLIEEGNLSIDQRFKRKKYLDLWDIVLFNNNKF